MEVDDGLCHQDEMAKILNECLACLKGEMDTKDAQGFPKFTDVCEWFADKLATEDSRLAYKARLDDLLDKCQDLGQVEALTGFQSSRPDSLKYTENGMEHLTKFSLRLWQIGVHEQSHVKGAPPLHAVFDNMQKLLIGHGNETAKYPLELLFDWGCPWSKGNSPEIECFTVGISIGSSVTMACHLLCWAVLKLGIMESTDRPADQQAIKCELAKRLLKCLCPLAGSSVIEV